MSTLDVRLTVNGESVAETVEPRLTLVDFLRETLGLTGSHVGCEHGVCGACTVRLDGAIVRGCLTLAAQCDGATVETIEGVSDAGDIDEAVKALAADLAPSDDVQTTGATKKHLAGVLLRRVATQLMETRA